MAKYLKLGEKASIFHDPTSGCTIKNKEVIPMTGRMKISKRVKKAIKNGHLDYASEKDYNKYLSKLAGGEEKTSSGKNEDKVDDISLEEQISSLKKKSDAIALIRKLEEDYEVEDVYDEADLEGADLKLSELKELALELVKENSED